MNTKRSFQIKKFIGDRAFYKRYLMLALPMILQNAITNLVSFLDNIMVGQLGTEQMSGVAIVNQLIFVYNLAIFGAASAASIFGAQYFGKGNHEGHMYSFRFKLYATMFVTILAITLFITNGENLISLYLTDTAGTGATDVAVWKTVSVHHADRLGSFCGYTVVCDKYQGNRADICTDGCKLRGSWKQCSVRLSVDIWNWAISEAWRYGCSARNDTGALYRSCNYCNLGTFP